MDAKFLPNADKTYRREVLRDNAERTEPFTYRKTLADSDISVAKDKVVQRQIDIAREEMAKKAVAQEYAQTIKEYKKERDEMLDQIRHASVEVNEEVYLIADQDESRMGYYNDEGDLVHSRPLTQDERQGRMKFLNTAQNNE